MLWCGPSTRSRWVVGGDAAVLERIPFNTHRRGMGASQLLCLLIRRVAGGQCGHNPASPGTPSGQMAASSQSMPVYINSLQNARKKIISKLVTKEAPAELPNAIGDISPDGGSCG